MPRPPGAVVVQWRDLAEAGVTYAEIHRRFSEYSANQIRHYCMGTSGSKLPGPIQKAGRFGGHNVWLQGERSPHAALTKKQALDVLNDWDEKKDGWGVPGAEWARRLSVSAGTIHMLRRGETWEHLNHKNQGRSPKRT